MGNHMGKTKTAFRGVLVLVLTFLVVTVSTYLVRGTLVVDEHPFLACLWLLAFAYLCFNPALILLLSLSYLLKHPVRILELRGEGDAKVAIVYPVRNEPFGLFERMHYSYAGNIEAQTHLWILSDSDPSFLEEELKLTKRLTEIFGEGKIFYRHRPEPIECKQGNILSWLHEHPEYAYAVVADADTILPKHAVERLVAKAEHEDNRDVAIIQARMAVAHAKTDFSRMQEVAVRSGQELYAETFQRLFGRFISYGHGCLLRTKAMRSIRLPRGILSHDIWETALLDRMGYRTVFASDVMVYEEVPSHYLEMRARDRRWARGTLQSWALLFWPDLTLATRFFVAYGIYLYLVHPVMLFWLALSFLSAFFPEAAGLQFVPYWFSADLSFPFETWMMLAATLGIIVGHKFLVVRKGRDFIEILKELLLSTLMLLNNIFYVSLDLLTFPFRSLTWKPMQKNPFEEVRFIEAVRYLWPGTLAGVLGFSLALSADMPWVWVAGPVLLNLVLAIPLTCLTSRPNRLVF